MIASATRPRLLRGSLAALVLGVGIVVPVAAGSAATPTIEPATSGIGFVWKPADAEVGAGGAVAFRSTSTTVPHGIVWKSGPEAPTCSGVPVDEGSTNWSGSCTFAQPGTYAFVCYVHPTEMKGTITVAPGEGAPGPPPGPGVPPPGGQPGSSSASESPLSGPASSALRLAPRQHGASVRGSIALSAAGGGGRLDVTLMARRASLSGAGHGGLARVGDLVRAGLSAGRVTFAVPVDSAARRALRNDNRLSLTVRVVLTPLQGGAVTLKRGVVLHV